MFKKEKVKSKLVASASIDGDEKAVIIFDPSTPIDMIVSDTTDAAGIPLEPEQVKVFTKTLERSKGIFRINNPSGSFLLITH